ncbi:MAG: hypothetical protein APR53_06210 [Methanoculleus sp. SDB]|nr:MAG: hypothetical protein APR53_06210 [Methanoculleus sp. SDB]
MEKQEKCQICGKPAIGIQILGCCSQVVCAEHADPVMAGMKPGEKKEWGACYFSRYADRGG